MRSSEGWLPNLARGVSVWKLVEDLNDQALFDGRLIEPETEGPDNLPTAIVWDVAELVPLSEAREVHAEALRRAVMDFHICIERSRPFFEPGESFDDYRDAFTLPTLQTDGGRHYFYAPEDGKLRVVNWGASRRHGAPGATLVLRRLSFRVFTGERSPPPPSEPRAGGGEGEGEGPPARSEHAEGGDAGTSRRWLVLGAFVVVAGALALYVGMRGEGTPIEAPPRMSGSSSGPAAPSPSPPSALPTTPPVGPASASVTAPSEDFVPERIYFAIGSAVLSPEAKVVVARLAEHLRATNGAALIEGHTDPTGAETENATLSARRALAVIGALRSAGVTSTLTGVGCAARYAASSDPRREAPATRRRVAIYVGEGTARPGCFGVGAR